MAVKASLTCFIVLTAFAIAGQLIFKMFGITLPAFEIAGGMILLLIGIDMMEAKRSPTQESSDDAEEAAAKEDAGIVPLGIPMLAGPGAISSVMVLVGASPNKWQMVAILLAIAHYCSGQLWRPQRCGPPASIAGRDGHSHPGAHYGPASGGAGRAVLCEWAYGPGRDC